MIIHHTVTIYQDNPKIVSAGLPEISLNSLLEQQWGLSQTTGDPVEILSSIRFSTVAKALAHPE